MREAGKKKMETQLPHLWNPHKIKKIRQDETEIQNINLGGTCTHRPSPLGWKRLALAGRDMCREIPHSATPNHWIGGLLFSVIALVFLMPVLMSYGKKPVRDKLNR